VCFLRFSAAAYISRKNCAETAEDRSNQSAQKFSTLNVGFGSLSLKPLQVQGELRTRALKMIKS